MLCRPINAVRPVRMADGTRGSRPSTSSSSGYYRSVTVRRRLVAQQKVVFGAADC